MVGVFGCLICAQAMAFAADDHERAIGSWSFRAPSEPDWPWRIYAGVASGYGLVSSREFLKSPAGEAVGLGASASYEGRRWIGEVGLSWFYSKDSGITSAGHSLDISTRMGVLDLGARR